MSPAPLTWEVFLCSLGWNGLLPIKSMVGSSCQRSNILMAQRPGIFWHVWVQSCGECCPLAQSQKHAAYKRVSFHRLHQFYKIIHHEVNSLPRSFCSFCFRSGRCNWIPSARSFSLSWKQFGCSGRETCEFLTCNHACSSINTCFYRIHWRVLWKLLSSLAYSHAQERRALTLLITWVKFCTTVPSTHSSMRHTFPLMKTSQFKFRVALPAEPLFLGLFMSLLWEWVS